MRKVRLNKFVVGTVLVLGMGLVTACGGSAGDTASESAQESTQNGDEASDFAAKELADSLLGGGSFKDELAELSSDVALTRLYALDSSKIEDSAFYTNTNATAEEIAVIKVNDSAYVQTVVDAYNKRIEDQKAACENYLPDEMPKLEAAVVKSSGDYVVLCISEDSAGAEDIISGYMK